MYDEIHASLEAEQVENVEERIALFAFKMHQASKRESPELRMIFVISRSLLLVVRLSEPAG